MLTFFDWFSGIGGFRLGLERAGMRCVGACEIDRFARRVYVKNFTPPKVFYRDIRKVDPADIPDADLWCGGFPCQDISRSGRGAGLRGSRSGLWFVWLDLVAFVRPRLLLVENSAALVQRGLDEILSGLAGLGYDAEWSTISACSMGAPHMRGRLFLLAYAKGVDGSPRMGDRETRPVPVPQRDDRADTRRDWISATSRIARGDHGVPLGLDRRRALGNAVVPAVIETIGRRIVRAFDGGVIAPPVARR